MTTAATAPRLAIVGDGKMGRTIVQLAPDRGFTVCAVVAAACRGESCPRAMVSGMWFERRTVARKRPG